MSTPWSTSRRRLGWALAPAALAALTYAGSAAANTCVLPGGYVGYNAVNGSPECLPNLEIKKTGPATVGAAPITWTITVYHRGYPGAADPYGTDAGIPIEAIHVDDDTLGLVNLQPKNPPADGVLRPGQALVYKVEQIYNPKRCDKESLENTASFTLDGITQTTTADDTSTARAKVVCTADVGIVKTADKSVYDVGQTVRWTVTVSNTGDLPIPVGRIKVDDPAAQLTPSDTNPGGVLKPGESMTFTAATTMTACGPLSNTASVSLDGNGPADGNPANNSSTASVGCTPPAPNENPGNTTGTPGSGAGNQGGGSTGTPTDVCPKVTVRLSISAAKRPFAGQLSTVVLRVNARNDAKKVKLTYRLPAGFAVVAKSPGTSLRRGTLVADLGSVKAGATRSVRLSVRILRTAKGRRQHTATVTATCASTARSALAANVRPLQGSINPAVTG